MPEQTSQNSSQNAGQIQGLAERRANLRKKSQTSQGADIQLNIPEYTPSDAGELMTDSFTPETERIYLPKLG